MEDERKARRCAAREYRSTGMTRDTIILLFRLPSSRTLINFVGQRRKRHPESPLRGKQLLQALESAYGKPQQLSPAAQCVKAWRWRKKGSLSPGIVVAVLEGAAAAKGLCADAPRRPSRAAPALSREERYTVKAFARKKTPDSPALPPRLREAIACAAHAAHEINALRAIRNAEAATAAPPASRVTTPHRIPRVLLTLRGVTQPLNYRSSIGTMAYLSRGPPLQGK